MTAINKANDCDLNYRTSKNQRLLVELTIMQIASITFDGEKKKPANYIIPATFFTSLSPAAKGVPVVAKREKMQDKPVEATRAATEKKPVLESTKRKPSRLSLKSIHEKKEETTASTLEENFDNHPKEAFTQKELEQAWKSYYAVLIKNGQKSIASILIADTPKLLANFKVQLTLPNKLMAGQLDREKPGLNKHLRESLTNYGITIQIVVSETVTKKFVYTPQEKYEKLAELNPLLKLSLIHI